ncbi:MULTISPECIES: mechanosensitive ion channel family protein [Azorhizobium]|uniref:mechanosensitive ion channel family protein n=1 Tax=Azorhizobium TaxID=6 RepID=UPI00105BE5E1|nr:mechanosensitive ion channel family protein [Azorhizobium sp. AG788]TDU00742.1 mechanosensitive ion channel-like protein [Azorhizobium sp. AG788]
MLSAQIAQEVPWTILIVLGFPLLTVLLIELTRRFAGPDSAARRPIKALQMIVVPAGAVWIIVHELLHLPPDGLTVKIVDTAVGILLLHAVFTILQSLIIAFSETVGRLPAPRLFYELGSSAVVAIGAAIIVSTIWDVDLGSLLGALGIGSVVLGLALQNVIGGLVAGVIVFSGRHFNLGDWLQIDGTPAKVVQIDWRAITVETLSGERIVVPSANMSSASLRITRARQSVSVATDVSLPPGTAPAEAKALLLEAARDVPQLLDANAVACRVKQLGGTAIVYGVSFPVADASQVVKARDAFLHRLWYVGQRHGVSVAEGVSAEELYGTDTPQTRLAALAGTGAFGAVSDDLRVVAVDARLRLYAAGEIILRAGEAAPYFLVLLSGAARVSLPAGGVVERLADGALYATRDAFRGTPSSVEVLAESEVHLLEVPVAAMERLLERHPALAQRVDMIVEARTAALADSLAGNGGAAA